MQSTLGPDVARAAVGLHRSHPHVPVLEVLDATMRNRSGRLSDLGDLHPCSDFGQLLAEGFDRGMVPMDWNMVRHPNTALAVVTALMGVWNEEVLPAFARRYGLKF